MLNATLTEKVLSTVVGLNTTRQVRVSLANHFASQPRSHITHLKRQLQTLHQGSKSCTELLDTAKKWAAQLATVGKPIDDDDLIEHVISGLNASFNPFIASLFVASQVDATFSLEDFQAELLSYEHLLKNQHQSVTSEAQQFAMFSPNQESVTTGSSPLLCLLPRLPLPSRTPSSQDYQTWFADSGANQHITTNLEQLTLQEPYTGSGNVAVGNGAGLQIQNTGSHSFHTSLSTLHLHRVLHCPQALLTFFLLINFAMIITTFLF